MLQAQRKGVRLSRKVYGPTHVRRRHFLKTIGADDRPNRAGPNSAPDMFGPRLTACRRSRRKEHACRVDARVRSSRGGDLSFGEGGSARVDWRRRGRIGVREGGTRKQSDESFGQRHDFLDGMGSRTSRRFGNLRSDGGRYVRGRRDLVAHRVDFAADIICCGAQRPGWRTDGRSNASRAAVITQICPSRALPCHVIGPFRSSPCRRIVGRRCATAMASPKGALKHDRAGGLASGRRARARILRISRTHTLRAEAAARPA